MQQLDLGFTNGGNLAGRFDAWRRNARAGDDNDVAFCRLCFSGGTWGLLGGGRGDREERRTHLLPYTREGEEERQALWSYCLAVTRERQSDMRST